MNSSNPQPQELSPGSPEQNQTIQYLVEAILLNRDNQPVATGSATLYPERHCGEFYPLKNLTVIADNLPQQAATLKASDGRLYRLKPDKQMCNAKMEPLHFHFEYEQLN